MIAQQTIAEHHISTVVCNGERYPSVNRLVRCEDGERVTWHILHAVERGVPRLGSREYSTLRDAWRAWEDDMRVMQDTSGT